MNGNEMHLSLTTLYKQLRLYSYNKCHNDEIKIEEGGRMGKRWEE